MTKNRFIKITFIISLKFATIKNKVINKVNFALFIIEIKSGRGYILFCKEAKEL